MGRGGHSRTRRRGTAEGLDLAPQPLGFGLGGGAGGGLALGLLLGGGAGGGLALGLLLGGGAGGGLALGLLLGGGAGGGLALPGLADFLGRQQVGAALGVEEPELFARGLQVKAEHLTDQPAVGLGDVLILAVDQSIADQRHS